MNVEIVEDRLDKTLASLKGVADKIVSEVVDEFTTVFQMRVSDMIFRYSHGNPTMNCGRRAENGQTPRAEEVLDGWKTQPDGTRTCSYCGSLHEEDFIDIVQHYVDGDAGYDFQTTDKFDKFYANRPDVKNASDGGIKFYIVHVDRTDPVKLQARADLVMLAARTEEKNLMERNRAMQQKPKA